MATTSMSKTGSFTSKSKIELGVDEERSVMWIPLDLSDTDRELLGNWNSQLNVDEGIGKDDKKIVDSVNYPLVDEEEYRKPYQRIRRELHKWLEANRVQITEVAEKFAIITEKSLPDLQKAYQASMNKMAQLEKMMEKARAAATIVEPVKEAKK